MREQPFNGSHIPDNLTEKRPPRSPLPLSEQPTLLPRRLSEVEALAVWTVLDYPLSSDGDQELCIVLKAEKDRLGGWVIYVKSQALC